jgi:two-component system nitrogen regulation sensor histidine kinase GlnL
MIDGIDDAPPENSGRLFPPGMLDQLETAVLWLDQKLCFKAMNLAAETLLEVSAARLINEPFQLALRTDDDWHEALQQVQNDTFPLVRRSMQLQLRSGSDHIVDAIISPIGHGEPKQLLIEITPVDRLHHISEGENLWQSQLTLRAVVKGLAHEVKNPLGGIRGAAQLLSTELNNPALVEYTDVIMQEVDRLRALVDRMLGPKEQLNIGTINIHEVVERVRQLISAEAGDTLHIVRDYDPSLPEFQADAAQLTQALLNIIRNAWQSCGSDGCITLRTRARRQYTLGGQRHRLVCSVEIIDNGPGVPEDLLPRLFIPMVTTRAEGTGLGLSIAQIIANRHGGLIQCQSEPGHTNFNLLLPMES